MVMISSMVDRKRINASFGMTSFRVIMIFSSRLLMGIYGIRVNKNKTAGTKAIMNEYEIELARREIELFFIPLMKNRPTS